MPENFHIDMPEAVRNIIHTIEEHGFKAYAVGGCIRDSILGRNPDDWDITTSAVPSQIKTFFKRTVDTGIAHGICFEAVFFNCMYNVPDSFRHVNMKVFRHDFPL